MNILEKIRKHRADQGGFTLIELLVVIGLLAILLAITLIAINPNKHFEDARNAQRSSDVDSILDAVYDYESDNNGNLPAALSGLSTTPEELCHSTAGTATCPLGNQIDLCSALVPTYIADLPRDPSLGAGGTNCTTNSDYDTGYQISEATGGRLTVYAPDAEDGQTIQVTR